MTEEERRISRIQWRVVRTFLRRLHGDELQLRLALMDWRANKNERKFEKKILPNYKESWVKPEPSTSAAWRLRQFQVSAKTQTKHQERRQAKQSMPTHVVTKQLVASALSKTFGFVFLTNVLRLATPDFFAVEGRSVFKTTLYSLGFMTLVLFSFDFCTDYQNITNQRLLQMGENVQTAELVHYVLAGIESTAMHAYSMLFYSAVVYSFHLLFVKVKRTTRYDKLFKKIEDTEKDQSLFKGVPMTYKKNASTVDQLLFQVLFYAVHFVEVIEHILHWVEPWQVPYMYATLVLAEPRKLELSYNPMYWARYTFGSISAVKETLESCPFVAVLVIVDSLKMLVRDLFPQWSREIDEWFMCKTPVKMRQWKPLWSKRTYKVRASTSTDAERQFEEYVKKCQTSMRAQLNWQRVKENAQLELKNVVAKWLDEAEKEEAADMISASVKRCIKQRKYSWALRKYLLRIKGAQV